jgi:hypothetical protein
MLIHAARSAQPLEDSCRNICMFRFHAMNLTAPPFHSQPLTLDSHLLPCRVPLAGSMLVMDLRTMNFRRVKTARRSDCPVCSGS